MPCAPSASAAGLDWHACTQTCLQLAHPPPDPPQVRTLFTPSSLEMWAVGAGAAYRLHLPRLWGRIIPGKCRAKVNQVRGGAQGCCARCAVLHVLCCAVPRLPVEARSTSDRRPPCLLRALPSLLPI